MLDLGNARRDGASVDLDEIGAAGQQLFLAQPEQMDGELLDHRRPFGDMADHVAGRAASMFSG